MAVQIPQWHSERHNQGVTRRYFHVTSSVNRASIEEHGLDWRLMGATHGIAGVAGVSMTPEVEGIFLLDSEDEIEWFAHMGLEAGHGSVDVWEVSLPADPNFVESEEGYAYIREPIPPYAIRLHIEGWVDRDPGSVAGDLFHDIYCGDGSVNPDLFTEKVTLIEKDGERRQGPDALAEWARSRSHGSPPRPTKRSDGPDVQVISNEGGFTTQGLDEGRCLVSPAAEGDFWTVVSVRDNRVSEVREFGTEAEALSNSGIREVSD